jgi:hypothetical protein
VAAGIGNIELCDEMLLSECSCPGWCVVANFFGWLVKCLSKLLELLFEEIRRSSGAIIVVEHVFEVALFEAILPVIHCLARPAILLFNLFRRQSSKVFTRSSKPLDCFGITLVRELLADSLRCEIGNLVPVFGHDQTTNLYVSKLPALSIILRFYNLGAVREP